MNLRWFVLFIGLLAFVLAFAWVHGVPAQEPDRGAWFESLRQPDTGLSCCSVSDCAATNYRDLPDGTYTAQLPDGSWTPIPPNKVVDRQSIDGDAYLCAGPRGTVYCFVPPSRGF